MMGWFQNLKTAGKLALGFGVAALLMLLIGSLCVMRMTTMHETADLLHRDTISGLKGILACINDVKEYRILQIRISAATGDSGAERLESHVRIMREQVERDIAVYEKASTQEEDRANIAELKRRWTGYLAAGEKINAVNQKKNVKNAGSILDNAVMTRFNAVQEQMDRMTAWNVQRGDLLSRDGEAVYLNSRAAAFGMMLAALLFSALVSVFTTRMIVRPLAQITAAAEKLALGDVQQEVTVVRRDEVGQVAEAFRALIAYQQEMAATAQAVAAGNLMNSIAPKSDKDVLGRAFAEMSDNLRRLIGEVASSAEAVASTSAQLSSSATQTGQAAGEIAATIQEVARSANQSATTSQETSRGSEQQARSATEAANAMDRLKSAVMLVQEAGLQQQSAARKAEAGMVEASKAVGQVAKSAQQMAQTAEKAAQVAQSGGNSVDQTVFSMSRIRNQVQASSDKVKEMGRKGQEIGAIVETINQIAEQTNLLALNAAIEAARAGEHGKGFAVVADEVRKLAERAAAATREIGGLIGSVRSGVDEAVQAMEASSLEVNEGAARSEEAGTALKQILQAAQSVASEVQSVTAIAQEMAAAVHAVQGSVSAVRLTADECEHAVREMASGAQQVNTAITNVAAISEQTAAGAEQMSAAAEQVSASAQNVSAAVQDQTASIEEVSTAAGELNTMASRLKELVGQFKLDMAKQSAPTLKMVDGNRKRAA